MKTKRHVDRPTTTDKTAVLSLFPGVGLLDLGFELEGFKVLRGPEKILGQRIEVFVPPRGLFAGVVGGSPCQDFSRARRKPPSGDGLRMLEHFRRVVTEAEPDWYLLENVVGVPDLKIDGFAWQRFNLRASEFGGSQNRNRCFQFGSRDGLPLVIDRQDVTGRRLQACAMASEGTKARRRTWSDFCALQGLPASFNLPGWSIEAKYRLVGNGVFVPMARAVATAIRDRAVTGDVRLCICQCGRRVKGAATQATAACRKRMERRRRDAQPVTKPGPDTPARSQ